MMTFMWQGVPVSVYYRTPDKIETLSKEQTLLQDAFSQKLKRSEYLKQYSNENLEIYNDVMHLDSDWVQTPLRSKRDELFVFMSSSPLTGCMLKFNVRDSIHPTVKIPKGWDGTFMDSCGEVFYDAAGWVFKHEKARYNLYVPNHHFLSDTVIELLPEGALVEAMNCKLSEILDGDSLRVDCDNEQQVVHLSGIMAPQFGSKQGICEQHPLAEKSLASLRLALDLSQDSNLVIYPNGKIVDGEIDAVVRVSPEHEEQVMRRYKLGPLYALDTPELGMSLDQHVLGYAELLDGHEQAESFKKSKLSMDKVNESSGGSFAGIPRPKQPKTLPAVCHTSPLEWDDLPQDRRCEIQQQCDMSKESWVNKAYRTIDWLVRILFLN